MGHLDQAFRRRGIWNTLKYMLSMSLARVGRSDNGPGLRDFEMRLDSFDAPESELSSIR